MRMFKSTTAILLLIAFMGAPAFATGAQESDANEKFEIVFIPKLIGIPWFNAMEDGLKAFAKENGNIKVTVAGAPDADPAQQARILEDTIARKPDCIIVVPNDTKALEPIMKKGMDAGILMITQEASSIQNAVADIEFLIPENVGRDYMETVVREGGSEGGYAIMVGGLTVESHNVRADHAVAYQEKHYPKMYQVTSRLEGSESVEESHDKTLELIQTYDDLKAILYIGSLGGIGGAVAVAEKNMSDQIAIVGTSVPSQAKKYLKEGTLDGCIISNPYRIGVDSAYIAYTLFNNGNNVAGITAVPEYGDVQIDGKIITFHAPAEVTVENADSFGF